MTFDLGGFSHKKKVLTFDLGMLTFDLGTSHFCRNKRFLPRSKVNINLAKKPEPRSMVNTMLTFDLGC